jgi:hypothetical protein
MLPDELGMRSPLELKLGGSILCRLFLNACSISFASDAGSTRQNDPLPGSSCDLGTLTKYRFNDKLCRIEFYP